MSDIMINIDCSGSSSTDKRRYKHKLLYKGRRIMENKGSLKRKQNLLERKKSTHLGPPLWNDRADRPTQHSAASTASSASSLTVTVNNSSSAVQNSFTNVGQQPLALRTVGHSYPTPGGSDSVCKPLKYLAIDCEMVGTGPKGRISELARCSIVSYNGDVVYDKYIRPVNPVTDYRTRWSGISRHQLVKAIPFQNARNEILKILAGKVVIGHAIHNDLKSLKYSHPRSLTRDTSRIPLLNQTAGFPEKEVASLKRLTLALFNRHIQTGSKGHSSVEDAKATMDLYKVVEVEWERTLAAKQHASANV